MANKNFNQFTAMTEPTDDDILLIADDPAGVPELKKISWANIKATLKGYFDTIYTLANLGGVPTSRTINSKALTDNISLSKSDIGLGNVDNTADASKPVSTAQQVALDGKVDKVTGKGLSTEDYSSAEKTKLAGIAEGANNYTHPATHSADIITDGSTNKAYTATEQSKVGYIPAVIDPAKIVRGKADGTGLEFVSQGALIHGLGAKTTPIDADELIISNSESSFGGAKVTWANIKATVKTYFDSIYALTGHNHTGTYKETGANETANIDVASDTASGKVELATIAETNTGTDATRAVTPDSLSGSVYGQKSVSVQVLDGATALATGDGKCYFRIPSMMNGMNLISCSAQVVVKSTSGNPTVMLARGRQANATSDFTYVDMLSTAITIDANEYDSKDATTAPAVNGSNDDVATGDVIRIDVDGAGTGTKGLNLTLTFQTP